MASLGATPAGRSPRRRRCDQEPTRPVDTRDRYPLPPVVADDSPAATDPAYSSIVPALDWQPVGEWRDIKYEVAAGVAKLTINRPHKRNAFRPQTLFELERAFAGTVVDRGVVTIDHGGIRTTYEPVTAAVAVGDPVVPGTVLGVVGEGAHCSLRCLHWGARVGDDYVEPLALLTAYRPVLKTPRD